MAHLIYDIDRGCWYGEAKCRFVPHAYFGMDREPPLHSPVPNERPAKTWSKMHLQLNAILHGHVNMVII